MPDKPFQQRQEGKIDKIFMKHLKISQSQQDGGGALNKNQGKKGSPEKRDGILHLFSLYRCLKSQENRDLCSQYAGNRVKISEHIICFALGSPKRYALAGRKNRKLTGPYRTAAYLQTTSVSETEISCFWSTKLQVLTEVNVIPSRAG